MTPFNENFIYFKRSESRRIINFNVLQNIVIYGTRLPAEAAVVYCSTARLPAEATVVSTVQHGCQPRQLPDWKVCIA